MPDPPKTIKVQIPVTQTIEAPVYLPFYYHSISSFWIYFAVDPKKLIPLLDGTGLKPGVFDNKALVNINFQNYTAHNGNSLAATDELEFNVIAYPEAREDDVPSISPECYLAGEDQTKTLGNYRVHVPCDNAFAVAAGKALFGENKFVANFDYNVPSLNNPPTKTWSYQIKDNEQKLIIGADVDIKNLVSETANPSAIVNYSMIDGRLVGSRRNILMAAQNFTNLKDRDKKKIKLTIGDSPLHNMATDLTSALGKDKNGLVTADPIAIQVIQSPPCIIESRPYFAGY